MGVLADLVDLRKDSTKAGKRPELSYLPIDAIPMKSIGISELKPNHEAKSSLQLFQRDDIIIGAMRVYFHRVVLAPCEGITRNTCFVLRPKNQLLREYALLTCFQPEAIEYANARAKGSTMPYAVWEGSFEAYPVLIPDESELEMFSKRVSPIIDKLRDSFDENGRLAKLRDALLPKLMSGEIDVSKVEMPTQPNNHLSRCWVSPNRIVPLLPMKGLAMETTINLVLAQMQPILTCDQLKRLGEVLHFVLSPRQESSTDLLRLFLTAKEVEGCSKSTILHMADAIGKPYTQIESDDLRCYLAEYESKRKAGKVTIDNIRRILSSFFS